MAKTAARERPRGPHRHRGRGAGWRGDGFPSAREAHRGVAPAPAQRAEGSVPVLLGGADSKRDRCGYRDAARHRQDSQQAGTPAPPRTTADGETARSPSPLRSRRAAAARSPAADGVSADSPNQTRRTRVTRAPATSRPAPQQVRPVHECPPGPGALCRARRRLRVTEGGARTARSDSRVQSALHALRTRQARFARSERADFFERRRSISRTGLTLEQQERRTPTHRASDADWRRRDAANPEEQS